METLDNNKLIEKQFDDINYKQLQEDIKKQESMIFHENMVLDKMKQKLIMLRRQRQNKMNLKLSEVYNNIFENER